MWWRALLFRARKDVDVDFPGEHIVGLTAAVAKFVAAHRMPFEDDHQVPGSRNGVRLNEDISSSRSRRTAFSSTSLPMRERISAFSARSRASSASRVRRRNEYIRVDLVPLSVDRWVPHLQLCRCRLPYSTDGARRQGSGRARPASRLAWVKTVTARCGPVIFCRRWRFRPQQILIAF